MQPTENYPKPPFPEQPIEPPGIEADMDPRPLATAPYYRGSGKLEGRVALITGGDSGIGRSVAILFAREGADVAFTHLPVERRDADDTCAAIEAEGRRALAFELDVRDPDACQKVVRQVIEELGQINILVNNAAFQRHVGDPLELSLEQWDETFKTNIYGYFHMVRAVLPHLGKGDVILNTGSITGLEGSAELLDYASTKGAIHAFTKCLAQSLVDRGIRVNCVAPGPVWTPLNPAERSTEDTKDFGKSVPFGRPAQPEEIAPAFVYLGSRDSSYVTGEILTLLGGDVRAG